MREMASAMALPSSSSPCLSSRRFVSHAHLFTTASESVSCSLLKQDARLRKSNRNSSKVEAAPASWQHPRKQLNYATFIKASAQQASVETLVGGVTDVDKDNFWPTVEAAGNKLVVLDMYTQWCGPCKLMHQKIIPLSEKYQDVVFLKLDCNQENKPLAKELGVRVVPTFKFYKKKAFLCEVTGAKYDELVATIDKLRNNNL